MTALDPTTTFDLLERNPEWLGFGYLGERRNALSDSDPESPARPEFVAEVDARLLDFVRREGWTQRELFNWANSKYGRWFGDVVFGSVPGTFTDEDWLRALQYVEKVEV